MNNPDVKCGYAWECWHFAQTASEPYGQVLILLMLVGAVLLLLGWVVRTFDL